MAESKVGTPFPELAPFCRKAAADGIVLLRNKENMLPLTKEDTVAIFGRCQIDYYRSGTGSGGSVNVPYSTNLISGLRNYEWLKLNEELIEVYEEWLRDHPFNKGDGSWASEPWHQEEMPLSDELVETVAKTSNKAIVVIGRTAGEDQDNEVRPGSYLLTKAEEDMVSVVTKHFANVAVVFNVSNIVDMQWTEENESVKAILYTWQGGIEGGNATADVLTGAVSPSGHLTDTIAKNVENYPFFHEYGDHYTSYYKEDIYVGYRYFETFDKEAVLYPFGYGLSYTTFDWQIEDAVVMGEGRDTRIQIRAKVKNTGSCAGKEVLQLYVEAPQGKIGRAHV